MEVTRAVLNQGKRFVAVMALDTGKVTTVVLPYTAVPSSSARCWNTAVNSANLVFGLFPFFRPHVWMPHADVHCRWSWSFER